IKSKKFQEFIKDPMYTFCMPPWSTEELLICKKMFTTVPQNLMLDLIDKVGEHSLRWASSYIFNRIEQKLRDSRWDKLFLEIQNPDDPSSSRGIMFESLVLHLLKVGKQQFEIRCIQGRQHLSNYDDETILIQPIKGNFGATDLIILPNHIFQITVSKNHPIKHSELVKIVKNIKAFRRDPNSIINLFFIVPEDIYDDFRCQKYITPKKCIGNDFEAYKE
ncbi:1188_t:CDS:2, partial [Racocetra fulgida]